MSGTQQVLKPLDNQTKDSPRSCANCSVFSHLEHKVTQLAEQVTVNQEQNQEAIRIICESIQQLRNPNTTTMSQ